MSFNLPDLPYAYDALEPHIDAKTMEIHHGKHHAGYVSKLNAAIENTPEASGKTLIELLRSIDSIPESKRTPIRNSGGGHYNHSLFWPTLSADGGGKPDGKLLDAINDAFGNFDTFQQQFTDAALGVFGSGWAWLVVEGNKKLAITSTPNQDSPLMHGKNPIFGVDVWEHAYYLKYQNRRPDYVKAVWNIVNWAQVARNYQEAV